MTTALGVLAVLTVAVTATVLVTLRRMEHRIVAEIIHAGGRAEVRGDVMLERVAAQLAAALRDETPAEPKRHLASVSDFPT